MNSDDRHLPSNKPPIPMWKLVPLVSLVLLRIVWLSIRHIHLLWRWYVLDPIQTRREYRKLLRQLKASK